MSLIKPSDLENTNEDEDSRSSLGEKTSTSHVSTLFESESLHIDAERSPSCDVETPVDSPISFTSDRPTSNPSSALPSPSPKPVPKIKYFFEKSDDEEDSKMKKSVFGVDLPDDSQATQDDGEEELHWWFPGMEEEQNGEETNKRKALPTMVFRFEFSFILMA